ncbi:MAG: DJ-1/PfpI family protein [Bacteroidota bacterium]|nr:DJ-1/PfpI family protein [Bacteroidota bacterium]
MKALKVAIFVFDGMTALDAVGPYEVLSNIPNSKVYFVSTSPGTINCKGGLKIIADYSLNDITSADILLIPGGPGVDSLLNNEPLIKWIKQLHQTTKFTVSVCTGSLLLGSAQLLQGLKATTHWKHFEKLNDYGAEATKSRYVIDGKIVTSAGVSAGIDMSLKLVELTGSESLAKMIQLGIEYDPMPPFDAGSPEKVSKELLEVFRP